MYRIFYSSEIIILFTIFGFVFGAIFGSFVNAAVYRLKEKISLVNDRSFCPHCKTQIKSYDLIPIFSYLILGGKCRHCKTKISPHYPLIEFITAVFAALFTYQMVTYRISVVEFVILFIILVNMMMIFLSDIRYREIQNENQIINFIACILLVVVRGDPIIFALVSGLFASGIFFLIFKLTGEDKIGLGDVKLVFSVGFIFQIFLFFYIILFSSLIGIIIGYIMSKVSKVEMRKVLVPLGSIIAFVTLVLLVIENIYNIGQVFKLQI